MALSLSQDVAQGIWMTSTSATFYTATQTRTFTSIINQTKLLGQWFDLKAEMALEGPSGFSCQIRIRNLSNMRLMNVQVATGFKLDDGTLVNANVTRIGDLGPKETRTVTIRVQVNFNIAAKSYMMQYWGIYYATAGIAATVTTTRTTTDYILAMSESRQTAISRTQTLFPDTIQEEYASVYTFLAAALGIIVLVAMLEHRPTHRTKNHA